jgi:lipoprotein-releasing system ATP-binding protein
MINDPLLIMCNVPTSNISNKNTDIVFHIFKELTTVYNKTLLEITHNLDFTNKTERIIELGNGKIIRS